MSKISLATIGIPIAAYLLGSIPFGVLFTRLFGGGDVRKSGSGNIGATNVARVAGPLPAVLTLLFDIAKGAAPVWLAARLTESSATWMVVASWPIERSSGSRATSAESSHAPGARPLACLSFVGM